MRIETFVASEGAAESLPTEGKFLQLRWRGEEVVIFADQARHRYHNQILAHFLSDQGITPRWSAPSHLEAAHPDLLVIGGGRFYLDRDRWRLRLWDASQAYGRFREAGLAEGLVAAGPPWEELTLVID